jgi:hypothetical protein
MERARPKHGLCAAAAAAGRTCRHGQHVPQAERDRHVQVHVRLAPVKGNVAPKRPPQVWIPIQTHRIVEPGKLVGQDRREGDPNDHRHEQGAPKPRRPQRHPAPTPARTFPDRFAGFHVISK